METGGSLGEVGVSPALPLLLLFPAIPVALDSREPALAPVPEASALGFSEGLVRPITASHVSVEIFVLDTGGYRKTS